jgi:hypothetical protein
MYPHPAQLKTNKKKRPNVMVQVVDWLPSKCEVLSSNTSGAKTNKQINKIESHWTCTFPPE